MALVIVLAFVVLLAGIVIAYLTRTSNERQLTHISFNQFQADQLARSALSIVVGDLKQEIADGSTSTTVNGITLYQPTQATNVLPQRSGITESLESIPNLIRNSIRSDAIARPGISSRASALSSAPDPSAFTTRRGEISVSRWNKHYLIPRPVGAAPTDTTPVSTFVAPDWVFVSIDNGPVVLSVPNSSIIGRYAFAIYDEGGLLDVNVAGYPAVTGNTPIQFGLKGFLSSADLTVIGLSNSAITDLIGWRNYATAQPNGSFGSFAFNTTSVVRYLDATTTNSTGFLTTNGAVWNGKTDQVFASRQMLIAYRTSTGFSSAALQHLGTFSRDRNLPTWAAAATRRVTSDFVRSDGSIAHQGDPLFHRFLLSKLSWVGPNGPTPSSRAPDIRRDFGLGWHIDHWDYYGANGSTLANVIPAVDGTSEPDFFQVLQFAREAAGLHPTMEEILSLGASIIDQFDGGLGDSVTAIEYAGNPAPSPAPPNPRAFGRENTAPSPSPGPTPIVLNRAFRNPGELGYAFKNSSTTLDLYTSASVDSLLLDLFTIGLADLHAGVINLNTRDSVALAAVIAGTIPHDGSSTAVSATNARNAALDITTATNPATGSPALGRHELAKLTAAVRTSATGTDEESRELISRSLTEVAQTRTWNLMIDIVAQSGRFPRLATTLSQFVTEGECRYWLHIAIDRFTGEVIDQQLEPVYE